MARHDSRQRMINAAIDLFQRQGVHATSIDQILDRSATGKSQFSHYFKTKDGLVHAAIKCLHEMIRDGQAGMGYEVKTWKDMDRWFQSYIDFQKSVDFERSCPVATIGNDILGDRNDLRKDLIDFLTWSRGRLTRFFRERKDAGELPAKVRPQALADFCISIMQGGMLLTKMKRSSAMFENAADQARAYLKSIRRTKKS